MHTFRKSIAALAVLAISLGVAGQAVAKEEVKVKTRFEALEDTEASGKALFKGGSEGAALKIKLKGLEEGATYTLETDGVERATFEGNDGKTKLVFTTPQRDDTELLFFDPREGSIVIRDAEDTAILSASLEGDEARTNLKEQTELEPTELAEEGVARARFDQRPNGKQRVRIHIKNAPVGDYQILFDGELQAEVTTNAGGNAKATFFARRPGDGGEASVRKNEKGLRMKKNGKPHNRKEDLDFDALDELVEIVRGEDLYWSGSLRAQIPGLNVCTPEMAASDLMRTDAITEGEADAEYSLDDGCEGEFEVEVDDVAAGVYQLFVDGVEVGEIEVTEDLELATSGKVEFSTSPEGDELPLTFGPVDVPIEVRLLEETLFTGSLTVEPPPAPAP